MEIEVVNLAGSRALGRIDVTNDTTIKEIKDKIYKLDRTFPQNRQSIRLDVKGKALKDTDTIKSLDVSRIFLKDLGPQISWKFVFLAEYAGPLVMYMWMYQRPKMFYGHNALEMSVVAKAAAMCWSAHYAKRLLETLFVHRFSHASMPLRNLFKNCSYYWLFALYVAYHVNHPFFTPPCQIQYYIGLSLFILCEIGNLSTHILLRNLRPAGSTVRKIPVPDSNPFTILFNYVSCPNYFYEFGAWASFTLMTQCIPAGLFAFAGFYQMAAWAIGKHKNYKKEFPNYPKGRKAIIPFIL